MKRAAALAAAALAGAAIGAASCDLVLDIGSLDRGYGKDAGSGGGGNSGGDGGDGGVNQVEIVATNQCYPGDIALAGGFLYWGTSQGSDGGCDVEAANSIARMALPEAGVVGSPVTVVSHDLGGPDAGGRPWTIAVAGGGVYWLGCGTLCTALADQEGQGCALGIKPPACASGIALAGSTLVFAGGCGGGCGDPGAGNGAIEGLDTADGGVSALGLQVASQMTTWSMSASDATGLSFAWIEGPADMDGGCVRLGYVDAGAWSSCDVALDTAVVGEGPDVYWFAHGTENTFDLVSHTPVSLATTLVTGIGKPFAMALDGYYVYFTAQDLGGSVYAVPRVPTHPTPIAQVTPLAANLAHPGHSGPYRITAADPTWLYWGNVAPDGTIERIRKPPPPQ